ncbi:Hypothetical predicted protein [Pelobates cultripes]|uniref:Uncharacterized protein n=1 Tax=Pelobates cultripes TaxID=61616 RepID=A0AAD1SGB4_PELCU|nr:Hypothetical predicted protein [Pelobates cultripes]
MRGSLPEFYSLRGEITADPGGTLSGGPTTSKAVKCKQGSTRQDNTEQDDQEQLGAHATDLKRVLELPPGQNSGSLQAAHSTTTNKRVGGCEANGERISPGHSLNCRANTRTMGPPGLKATREILPKHWPPAQWT